MTGPLTPFKAGFAAELRRLGYAPSVSEQSGAAHGRPEPLARGRGLGVRTNYSPADVERFAGGPSRRRLPRHFSTQALVPLLAYLRELGAVPRRRLAPTPAGPVEELLWRYRRYLAVERGLSERRCFATWARSTPSSSRAVDGELELSRLSAADISAFVLASCQSQRRAAAQDTISVLRSLLGFLHQEGVIKQ